MKAHEKLIAQKVAISRNRSTNNGIYFLLDENDEVVYIGQSINGISRIFDHLKGSAKNKKQFEYYVWIPFPGSTAEELSKYEESALQKYQPKYNISKTPAGIITDGKSDYYTISKYAKVNDLKHYVVRDCIYRLNQGPTPLRCLQNRYYCKDDLDKYVKTYCHENNGRIDDFNPFDRAKFKANYKKKYPQ